MSYQTLWLIVMAVEILVFTGILFVFDRREERRLRDREDAAKWRSGQKPIGKLLRLPDYESGLKVEGRIQDPFLAKQILGPMGEYSIGPSIPPRPEWEVKRTHFDIAQAEMLDMDVKTWELFTKKIMQVWVNMLENDGYRLRSLVTSHIEESDGLLYGKQRVTFEVECYKDREKS